MERAAADPQRAPPTPPERPVSAQRAAHGGERLEALLDGSLTVAFIRPVARFRALAFETILREQLVAVLPHDHRLAAAEKVDLAELADERFVLMSKSRYPGAYDVFEQACHSAGFNPLILDEGDSPNAMYIVAAGLGVALAPASAQGSGLPGVVFKPFAHPTPEVELAVAYRKDNRSKSLIAFLETIHILGTAPVTAATPQPMESKL